MHWIFGYGSLIWRPDFLYSERRRAGVRGWRRRFWQASPDHRGVPDAPGRVVTLVREPDAMCWGVAFMVAAADHDQIMTQLDRREKNGYERIALALEFDDGTAADGITYVAGPRNPSFVGPAPLEEMVEQIASAIGPSGRNSDYLIALAETLRDLCVYDDEVEALRSGLLARDAAFDSG